MNKPYDGGLSATAHLLLAKDGPRLFDALRPTDTNIAEVRKFYDRILQWCEDNDVCDHCWAKGPGSHCRCWDDR